MTLYILVFCRVVIGLVFLVSSFSKVLNLAQFRQAISSFNLLPKSISGITALLVLCGEFTVTGLMAIGGFLLLPGFLLALILLLIFSGALISVLVRRFQTTCNCFGPSKKPVRIADVWRNLGFILCTIAGCATYIWAQGTPESLGTVEWFSTGVCASVFVLLCTQLSSIARLFADS